MEVQSGISVMQGVQEFLDVTLIFSTFGPTVGIEVESILSGDARRAGLCRNKR
jgi:hypothetical protein